MFRLFGIKVDFDLEILRNKARAVEGERDRYIIPIRFASASLEASLKKKNPIYKHTPNGLFVQTRDDRHLYDAKIKKHVDDTCMSVLNKVFDTSTRIIKIKKSKKKTIGSHCFY